MDEAVTPPKRFPKKTVLKKKYQRLECFEVFTAASAPAWGLASGRSQCLQGRELGRGGVRVG